MGNLNKKIIIITGASSGIGKEIVLDLASEGALVVACARRFNSMEKEFKNIPNVLPDKLDVSDHVEVKKMVEYVFSKFHSIDVLVNNAAICSSAEVDNISISEWIQTININISGMFYCTKYSLQKMKKKNYGRIINISSGGSVNCSPKYSLYSLTKASVNAFTKSLGSELKNYNIKANTMSPGPCRTEMFPENPLDPKVCLPTVKLLATLPINGKNGRFFWMEKEVEIFPDLTSIDWSDPSSYKT